MNGARIALIVILLGQLFEIGIGRRNAQADLSGYKDVLEVASKAERTVPARFVLFDADGRQTPAYDSIHKLIPGDILVFSNGQEFTYRPTGMGWQAMDFARLDKSNHLSQKPEGREHLRAKLLQNP